VSATNKFYIRGMRDYIFEGTLFRGSEFYYNVNLLAAVNFFLWWSINYGSICSSYFFDAKFALVAWAQAKIRVLGFLKAWRLECNVCLLCLQINGSLLPASVISVYCTYLCYSALSSEPRDYECNGLHNHSKAVSTGSLTLGLLTTVLCVVYSAVRAGSSTTLLSPPSSPRGGQVSRFQTVWSFTVYVITLLR